jgi:hypothetical protein
VATVFQIGGCIDEARTFDSNVDDVDCSFDWLGKPGIGRERPLPQVVLSTPVLQTGLLRDVVLPDGVLRDILLRARVR